MMLPKFVIHLYSGGLDSTVLLYDLLAQDCRVHCLLFDYGQKHARELDFARLHTYQCGVEWTTVELPERLRGSKLTGDGESWVVPFRNPIMLAMAVNLAVAAHADSITIGCNADDAEMFPDCRWATLDALNHAIKLSGYSVEICAPYVNMRKWEIGELGRKLGVAMEETWSCYGGGENPCGTCPACQKRELALNHDAHAINA